MAELRFEESMKKMLAEQEGVYFPVSASLPERLLVRKISPKKLRPNADDEFCHDGVGPCYRIISEYEQKIKDAQMRDVPAIDEPLIVEKMRPNGYRIVNGHHRWAAAWRMGLKKVPIHIVNFVKESEIKQILEKSDNVRRVSFDLDEVLLRSPEDPFLEKALCFPLNLRFRERIRLGVPALFHFFKREGYDIWVYSSNYYSFDDVMKLLSHYGARIDGAVTGMGKAKQTRK
nr:ParB/RepB/Spo0J family partition protein [Lachnospiraceae bacterium]